MYKGYNLKLQKFIPQHGKISFPIKITLWELQFDAGESFYYQKKFRVASSIVQSDIRFSIIYYFLELLNQFPLFFNCFDSQLDRTSIIVKLRSHNSKEKVMDESMKFESYDSPLLGNSRK